VEFSQALTGTVALARIALQPSIVVNRQDRDDGLAAALDNDGLAAISDLSHQFTKMHACFRGGYRSFHIVPLELRSIDRSIDRYKQYHAVFVSTLQTRVDRLALQRQHAEHALMHPP